MSRLDDELIVRDAARRLYGDGQPIWDPKDRWNSYKRASISAFCSRHASHLLSEAEAILDAGCGSEAYPWMPERSICLDRHFLQTRAKSNGVVGDLCSLPFEKGSFDFVVCVASVLNYVSAIEAISEVSRVLRPGGHLILHYETSTSFEHVLKSTWGMPVARTETINGGRPDTLWVYRPSYITTILRGARLQGRKVQRFHIASALGLRIGLGQQTSAKFAVLDPFVQRLGMFADDVIILAEKLA
ncbi:Methyltransferase domain-containing protein [Bradyrhizobium sp. OK095]|nr:Methyltransferase domain-containing protein [Bradyrhizobium sp. OK095]